MQAMYMVGGGTKDRLLCQWIAESTGLPLNTGLAETTSVGNLLMQLKAENEIRTLEEGRQICLNSAVIKQYLPQNKKFWDDKFEEFKKFL